MSDVTDEGNTLRARLCGNDKRMTNVTRIIVIYSRPYRSAIENSTANSGAIIITAGKDDAL